MTGKMQRKRLERSVWAAVLLSTVTLHGSASRSHSPAHPSRIAPRHAVTVKQGSTGLGHTACTATLDDHVSGLPGYKLKNLIWDDGQLHLYGTEGNLPPEVRGMFKPGQAFDPAGCYLEHRPVLLLPFWQGDFNTYHNFFFFIRRFVHLMIASWGAPAVSSEQVYYAFYNAAGDALLSAPGGGIIAYKSLEVFFKGEYKNAVQLHNRTCVSLQDVVLVPKILFFSGKYDTQKGIVLQEEKEVYSLMRDRYVQKFAQGVKDVDSAAEGSDIRILYLGRTKEDARHVVNDEELVSALSAFAYDRKGVQLSTYHQLDIDAFQEQVALLASTDVLIGPHGSALTNVLWMRPQSVLLELLPQAWSDPCFRNLAIFSGKTYLHWQQTNASLSEPWMMKRGKMEMVGRSANFHVNVHEVLAILKQAVNIVSMVGNRWDPPCPSHEFLRYKRAAPIQCERLWKRDEGILGDTPLDMMHRHAMI